MMPAHLVVLCTGLITGVGVSSLPEMHGPVSPIPFAARAGEEARSDLQITSPATAVPGRCVVRASRVSEGSIELNFSLTLANRLPNEIRFRLGAQNYPLPSGQIAAGVSYDEGHFRFEHRLDGGGPTRLDLTVDRWLLRATHAEITTSENEYAPAGSKIVCESIGS